jgi:hypothetical protein
MYQSKLYSRLRLNPVPESLNSPDVPTVPLKNRPAQMDDPVRHQYGRDLASSYHAGTATAATAAVSGYQRQMSESVHLPVSSHQVRIIQLLI